MLGKLTEQQVEIHDVTFLQQIFQSDIIILLQQVDIAVPGTSPLPRHVRQSVACTCADTNRIRKSDAPERFVMVTTNCLTGEADYFEEKKNKERVIDIVRASSSLPFVCPVTYVDNIPMLDGGIADSIPLMRARRDGYDRNVVVLTRNRGYRKDIQGTKVPSFIYRKYPRLREAINRRSSVYNEQLELVERLEDAGEITVIRPQKPIVVDRIERDISKLTDLYEEGYACAAAFSFSSDNIK